MRPRSYLILLMVFFCYLASYHSALGQDIPITKKIIENISVKLPGEKNILTFKDGIYSNDRPKENPDDIFNHDEGGIEKIAFGDLNGDKITDGAFIVSFNSGGGSSTFYYLYAAAHKDGKIIVSEPFFIGDRVEIKSFKINSGKIYLAVDYHLEGSGRGVFAFRDGKIIDLEKKQTSTIKPNATQNKSNSYSSQDISTNTDKIFPANNVQSNLTGNWTGDFQLINPHGKKYTAHYSYIISQDPSDPSRLTFKQTNTLTFVNKIDVFSCNNSNTCINSYEGVIKNNGQEIKFIQQKISNPSCGSPDTDTFRLNGSSLEAVHVDGGKITTGELHR